MAATNRRLLSLLRNLPATPGIMPTRAIQTLRTTYTDASRPGAADIAPPIVEQMYSNLSPRESPSQPSATHTSPPPRLRPQRLHQPRPIHRLARRKRPSLRHRQKTRHLIHDPQQHLTQPLQQEHQQLRHARGRPVRLRRGVRFQKREQAGVGSSGEGEAVGFPLEQSAEGDVDGEGLGGVGEAGGVVRVGGGGCG